MPVTYVKKLIASHGWLRRLDAVDPDTNVMIPVPDQPFMRISGIVKDGWMEVTDTSDYIRWIGEFHASVVQSDGTVSELVSRNMIFTVLDDAILACFKAKKKQSTVRGRTDQHYIIQQETEPSFLDDFQTVHFVVDLHLKQPEKPNRVGYEYAATWKTTPYVSFDLIRLSARLDPFYVPQDADTMKAEEPVPAASEVNSAPVSKADPAPVASEPEAQPEPQAAEQYRGPARRRA